MKTIDRTILFKNRHVDMDWKCMFVCMPELQIRRCLCLRLLFHRCVYVNRKVFSFGQKKTH